RQAAEWRRTGPPLSISVNVSATSLLEPGFVESVANALEEHGLPANALVLEITEGIAIRNFAGSRNVIERFAQLGVVVSIDDFGAGATSLMYLSELSGISELKLDRAFLAGVVLQRRELELVRATVELGHAVGLRVVAEGVEDAETLELISAIGCDMAQGFFIGRPVPASDFEPHFQVPRTLMPAPPM
ncbi:MAG TPA: EAL domain-containing protein, partial [Acidimicrobiales bacterium]|nr:EAL domain-containing protein [Acidimicrobiales bacterium]